MAFLPAATTPSAEAATAGAAVLPLRWTGTVSWQWHEESYPDHLLCTPPNDGTEHAVWDEAVTVSLPSADSTPAGRGQFQGDISYTEDGYTCQPGALIADAQWHGTGAMNLSYGTNPDGSSDIVGWSSGSQRDPLIGQVFDLAASRYVATAYSVDFAVTVPAGVTAFDGVLPLEFGDSVSNVGGPTTALVHLRAVPPPEAVLKGKEVILDTVLAKNASARCPAKARVTIKTKSKQGRIEVTKQLRTNADPAGCRVKGKVRLPTEPKHTAKVKVTITGKKLTTRRLVAARL
ncbi:hypothetical protein GON03_09775 [Nocardioides sp. MAH-18]|uniref:Uncharacterized protein n=1 Tax=Nocardioides agri TaxID=2682843 RepID=A0A6L6XQ56_9ACTN|nr:MULTISPECIES: hypothetical protein [unclassified Nocardioides]MBA2954614.1 hypothetical protein [Nocardioides sp. CGMCC 1.13656]MVQ49471.1 hypothetical protein [Nocardioides sp. MAH-18]